MQAPLPRQEDGQCRLATLLDVGVGRLSRRGGSEAVRLGGEATRLVRSVPWQSYGRSARSATTRLSRVARLARRAAARRHQAGGKQPAPRTRPVRAGARVQSALRPLRRQRCRDSGTRLLLRKPHYLHSHLSRPTRRRTQLQLVLLGRPAGRERPHLRRLPLPLLRRRRRHTRRLRRCLHPQPHRTSRTRKQGRPAERLTTTPRGFAHNDGRCRKATTQVRGPATRASHLAVRCTRRPPSRRWLRTPSRSRTGRGRSASGRSAERSGSAAASGERLLDWASVLSPDGSLLSALPYACRSVLVPEAS